MERLTSLSELEESFILDGVACGVRADGRTNSEYRVVQIQTSTVIPTANGSAKATVGGTEVLCGVKLEIVDSPPNPNKPNHGAIICKAECSSVVLSQFGVTSRGQRRDVNAEITLLLQRLYNENTFDLQKLCVVPNRFYWVVYVDCVVVALDGSLLDALSFAIRAALLTAEIPLTRVVSSTKASVDGILPTQEAEETLDFEVSPYAEDCTKLPFDDVPIWISQVKIGGKFVVDSTLDEEICMNAKISVGVNRKGKICGVVQTGSGGIAPSTLITLTKNAKQLAGDLILQIDAHMNDPY